MYRHTTKIVFAVWDFSLFFPNDFYFVFYNFAYTKNPTKNTIRFMKDYSEDVFHLIDYCFVFKRSAVSEYQFVLQIFNIKT